MENCKRELNIEKFKCKFTVTLLVSRNFNLLKQYQKIFDEVDRLKEIAQKMLRKPRKT